MSMERYLCVHGHFYQPPRENPWLERVEVEDSADPYHDWNARITAECYEPNTASRIMDPQGRILRISDNYSRMSFNVGPTLLGWMESQAPEVYRRILAADRRSQETFGGHGSALAQAYNHVILPLANPRDQRTEIVWGIRDFEHRFGRPPEGLWLPETAVDLASLEICAEHGIRFVLLAPHQARRVRPLNGNAPWSEVTGNRVDPTCAYLVRLPSGRSLSAFFYDGPISQAVAFGHLLDNGEVLAQRLVGAFSEEGKFGRTWPQLVHIATDGETYGHHHRHGDMALSYALHLVETRSQARLTNYGEYLTLVPPAQEVEIAENTSWSCPHGVERWRGNCGCQTGLHPGWNQAWRAPLRAALDWLRDEVAPRFEEKGRTLFHDPWAARDDYVQVVLDRSEPTREGFFSRHARIPLSPEQRTEALKLLELQRHALLMYTSCGWFFDELSGIETVQVLRYAGRVIQLAEELFDLRLEPAFLERLRAARSNLPEQGDGAEVYRRYALPSRVDLGKVAAHYAISSLFEPYEPDRRIYCYRVQAGGPPPGGAGPDPARPRLGDHHLGSDRGERPLQLWGGPLRRPQLERRDPAVPGQGGLRGLHPGGRGVVLPRRPGPGHPAARRALRRGHLLLPLPLPGRTTGDPGPPHPGWHDGGRERLPEHLPPVHPVHAFLAGPELPSPPGLPDRGGVHLERQLET
ncbi:glycoside hydrolase family protein, partial [mine drainage metagenome]